WRVIEHLGDQSGTDDDEAGYEHDEDGGTVARIGKAVIEPADFAARRQGQKAAKQFAPAAARTGAAEPRAHGIPKRADRLGHGVEYRPRPANAQANGGRPPRPPAISSSSAAVTRRSRRRPRRRCRRTGTATPRRRSASTRRRTRSRDAGSA